MESDLQAKEEQIIDVYNKYVDMIYRICFMLLKNPADAEDAVQAVFTKFIEKEVKFQGKEHEKAWFIVTAQNHCKNQLRHWWRKNVNLDAYKNDLAYVDKPSEVLEIVLRLPEKFKMPIYLYYYEGYSTDEIAKLLELNASTLRSRLKKARELLKDMLGGDLFE